MRTIVIAAPASGSGKTTVTLGLLAALRRRGLVVAPFKVGPDFIDPGYHRLVIGRPSANLDGWMCGETFVRETFARHAEGADVAVIEGVMGLFDGIGGASEEGSTAQVAKLLGAPVVLVVDAKGQARSAAALIQGFAAFDPQVHVAGVIFNRVASESHARTLREAVAAGCPQVRLLGCLPRDERLHIPSRHLGLVTAEENPLSAAFLEHLAETMENGVDLDGFVQISPFVKGGGGGFEPAGEIPLNPPLPKGEVSKPVRLAVARDAAFCFVYEENLRLLRKAGAQIVEFSPLHDERLPEGIGGLYLPGGYPELFAEPLAANETMKESILQMVEAGMPVYAECGGLVYLTRGVATDVQERERDFVGLFPVVARMLPTRKALGYRQVELAADCLLGQAGTVARGHEFHYSEIEAMPASVERLYRLRKNGVELGPGGFRYKNCLASYIHLHFGSNPAMAAAFVESCRKFRKP